MSSGFVNDVHKEVVRRGITPDHLSCSIEYPNVWYLRKASQAELIFQDWVILAINPNVLWRDNSLFSPVNSATENGRYLQAGIHGFQQLFLDKSPGRRSFKRTPKTPLSVPTDGQAEAMIYNFIETDMIMGGVFSSADRAKLTMSRLKGCGIGRDLLGLMRWTVSPELFSTEDRIRRKLLEDGIMPAETTIEVD